MQQFNQNSRSERPSGRGERISSVLELICNVNPSIQSLRAVEYVDPLLIQDRIPGIQQTVVFKQAAKMRQETLLPFWDSALAQALQGKANIKQIVDAAMFHNNKPEITHTIKTENAEEHLNKLLSHEWSKSTLALSSNVILKDGSQHHIPMLDFHIPSNDTTYETVVECLDSLEVGKFVIVDSGKSYHAYGLSLLNNDGLRNFLFRALLLSPIVDSRYVAHQLLDEKCKLRVVATSRKPTEPIVLGIT